MATTNKHAGSRRGPKPSPTLRPRSFALALAMTACVIAWGYLVYLAIDFGTSARGGETQAWWFLGVAALGAVLCLFLGLVLLARLTRSLGITAPPDDPQSTESDDPHSGGAASRPPGGRRAAR